MLLPRKIHPQSAVHLVHIASPVGKKDLQSYNVLLEQLKKKFPRFRLFDVVRGVLDPQYLAASEEERLKKFKKALKGVDWLMPIYGGTGAMDVVRYLDKEDIKRFVRTPPVVNGFSDTTSLINFLYFKLGLITFHYKNGAGIFSTANHKVFFDVIEGRRKDLTFFSPQYKWINRTAPRKTIEGIAIGGNLETMRDLIDICEINPPSWKKYILFIEDVHVHVEDIHRILIALDAKGIFDQIRALVVGSFETKKLALNVAKIRKLFGTEEQNRTREAQHVITYLLHGVINDRREHDDPLYILNVDDLGHEEEKNPMIIPIGARTIITPDRKIKFIGPFVK